MTTELTAVVSLYEYVPKLASPIRTLAFVDLRIGDFKIHEIRILAKGAGRPFVVWPSLRTPGGMREVFHPATNEARARAVQIILAAYTAKLEEKRCETQKSL